LLCAIFSSPDPDEPLLPVEEASTSFEQPVKIMDRRRSSGECSSSGRWIERGKKNKQDLSGLFPFHRENEG
jgi:hypothetical protein